MVGNFTQGSDGIPSHLNCDHIANNFAPSATNEIQHRIRLIGCEAMTQSRFPPPNLVAGSESLSAEQLARFRSLNAGVDSASTQSEWSTVQSKNQRKQQQKKTEQNWTPPTVSKSYEATRSGQGYGMYNLSPHFACAVSSFTTLAVAIVLIHATCKSSSFFKPSVTTVC